MNIVLIKHAENDSKQYLFEVPEGVILTIGDFVCVENKKGKHIGICTCDSAEVPKNMASAIVRMNGGGFPLAKVTGIYRCYPFSSDEVGAEVKEAIDRIEAFANSEA